jgi:hypothetical protein
VLECLGVGLLVTATSIEDLLTPSTTKPSQSGEETSNPTESSSARPITAARSLYRTWRARPPAGSSSSTVRPHTHPSLRACLFSSRRASARAPDTAAILTAHELGRRVTSGRPRRLILFSMIASRPETFMHGIGAWPCMKRNSCQNRRASNSVLDPFHQGKINNIRFQEVRSPASSRARPEAVMSTLQDAGYYPPRCHE